MKIKIFVLFVFSVLLVSCSGDSTDQNGQNRSAGARGGQWQANQQEQKALSVRAFNVSRRSISNYIVSNTTFESIREVNVYSKLNAIVSVLNVEEGDVIRKGQELARLEEREIRNEFDQARIAVDQARVSLQQAEVRAELSQAEYERATSLFEQKLTSKQDFDQAKLTSRTDSLAADNAKQQLEAAEARLEAAQIQLEYTSIQSPISGVLTQRLVDIGDRVNVNEQLFSVQEFPPLWARIYVPEKSLPQLNLRQEARIQVETYPDREFEGRIKLISPTIDSASGTVKVTIEVSQPGNLLRPGMFGTVYIATETRPNAVVIPKKAVIRERDLNFVFTIEEGGKVQRREIETGFSEEEWVEVASGLETGETLVTVGHETLSDGYPVMVQAWDGEAPSEARLAAIRPSQADESSAPAPQDQMAGRSERPSQSGVRESAGPNRAGPGGGGREQFFQRLLQNPEIKKKWEAKLKEDPSVATDPSKRRAFVREVMSQLRGNTSR